MRKKIFVKGGTTPKELMGKGVPKATAYRAAARGWYWENFFEKEVKVSKKDAIDYVVSEVAAVYGDGNFNETDVLNRLGEEFYRMAYGTFRKLFWKFDWLRSDLVQAAVLRQWELSGVDLNPSYRFKVCMNTMRAFVQAELRQTRGEPRRRN